MSLICVIYYLLKSCRDLSLKWMEYYSSIQRIGIVQSLIFYSPGPLVRNTSWLLIGSERLLSYWPRWSTARGRCRPYYLRDQEISIFVLWLGQSSPHLVPTKHTSLSSLWESWHNKVGLSKPCRKVLCIKAFCSAMQRNKTPGVGYTLGKGMT